jgi:hypothetical protein
MLMRRNWRTSLSNDIGHDKTKRETVVVIKVTSGEPPGLCDQSSLWIAFPSVRFFERYDTPSGLPFVGPWREMAGRTRAATPTTFRIKPAASALGRYDDVELGLSIHRQRGLESRGPRVGQDYQDDGIGHGGSCLVTRGPRDVVRPGLPWRPLPLSRWRIRCARPACGRPPTRRSRSLHTGRPSRAAARARRRR